MNTQPLVSVIIPIYKVEEYLRCCLDSVLTQTCHNLEVILVDDGSPDGCPAICDEYAQKDPRITVIHQKNGGLSAARNAGMERMHGSYVTFIDSDDFIHRNYVEYLLQPCLEQDAEVSIGDFVRVNADAELSGFADTSLPEPELRCVTGKEASSRCEVGNADYLRTTVACRKMIKRELLREIRFPVGMIHEDEATSYRYLYAAKKVVYVDAAVYFYRNRPSSIMSSKFSDKSFDFLDIILPERVHFYQDRNEQDLADMVIKNRYWWILDYYDRIKQAGENLPERTHRLRRTMAQLYRDAYVRRSISPITKLRYLLSIPFLKTASRYYRSKAKLRQLLSSISSLKAAYRRCFSK